ncbi:hypothetical protein ACFXPA_22140 [Amycolatopsis sp. NPDC059090]|uniref:hypothetical protein n=1 Tax=unclassified Amycolatopsis TaxID=2618356 RepID=UPI00366AFF93
MHEHPPGYEAEQPIDLTKAVPVDVPAAEPPSHQPRPKDPAWLRRRSVREALTTDVPGSWLTVVANVKPRTYKTTVTRMLETVLGHVRDDIRFVDGARRPVRGRVIADSPSYPRDTVWQPWVRSASQLVIPVPEDAEAARAAVWMLNHLEAEGLTSLTGGALTVVLRTGRDRRLLRQIRTSLGRRTAQVVTIRPDAKDPENPEPWVPLATALLARLALRTDGCAAPPDGTSGRVVPLHSYQRREVS